MKTKGISLRYITVTAVFSAVAAVLMMLSFNVPLMPSFIKFDFSELPVLIASFAIGPLGGASVSLIKNLVNLFFTTTGGVGELSNFILSAVFAITAGTIYKHHKTRRGAAVAALIAAFTMAVVGVFSNYFIIYPLFSLIGWKSEMVLGLYQEIYPNIRNLWQALCIFNLPFTFIKGMVTFALSLPIYKKLSPIIKGRK
ncbi:MAG: ECF transporter S component [Eubacteriales bacterium]